MMQRHQSNWCSISEKVNARRGVCLIRMALYAARIKVEVGVHVIGLPRSPYNACLELHGAD